MAITLRDVKTTDAEVVTKWKTDPYITKMKLEHAHQTNVEEQRHDIQMSIRSIFKEYKIILHDDHPIGYIRVDWMDTQRSMAWIRFALGEERGRGYSREALELYVKELFANGCRRIEGEVYEQNIPAQKVIQQIGFVLEGVKRRAHYDGDTYTDIYCYGMLPEDLKV